MGLSKQCRPRSDATESELGLHYLSLINKIQEINDTTSVGLLEQSYLEYYGFLNISCRHGPYGLVH